MSRRSIQILNATDPARAYTSRKRAAKAVARGVAVWVVRGVSMRLVAVCERVHRPVRHVGPSLPAPVWVACWRTSEAAVLQPYQPYQRGVGL